MSLDHYIQTVCDLNIGRIGTHERPHKPALLLAIISMIEAGRCEGNRIVYGPELQTRFRRFFGIVRGPTDTVNMIDPFWRLRTDGLLEHRPLPGLEAAVQARRDAPSVGELRAMSECSKLPEDLYQSLQESEARNAVRNAIISRYFAGRAADIQRAIQEEQRIGAYEQALEADPAQGSLPSDAAEEPLRDQAFRRIVLKAYDHRCSACGLRVVYEDLVLVEAAHLVPFSVGRDDDPRNGIALCRNHHWAMDGYLIAPTPTLKWQVSRCLDDRIEGQRDLLDLRGRSLILPRPERFHPKADALAWRESHLLGNRPTPGS
jgi:putative restriction endonuclease